MANIPLGSYLRKAYQDFSGGLNTYQNPLIIKENQFAQLDNAIVNGSGLLQRDFGYQTDGTPFPNDADSWIRMIANFKRGTSVDNLVVAALDEGNANATYKIDLKQTTGNGTYDYIGYTDGTATFTQTSAAVVGVGTSFLVQLKAGDKIKPSGTSVWYEISSIADATNLTLTAVFAEATQAASTYKARIILNKDYIPSSLVFNNVLIVTNGVDNAYTWDNTTTALLTDTAAPKGAYIESHKNRVFMAKDPSGQSTIYWSASRDQTDWDSSAKLPVYPQDNSTICAIRSFADSLLVFKDNGNIYQILGDFDQNAQGQPSYVRKLDGPDNLGPIAGYTIAIHDDGKLYFMAKSGVYSIDQRMMFEKVSWPIDEDVSSIVMAAGPVSAKAIVYDSTAQWNTGTLSGVKVLNGSMGNFFDSTTAATAKAYGSAAPTLSGAPNAQLSMCIDSSSIVHIARTDGVGSSLIYYGKYALDNTYTEELAYTGSTIFSVGIGIAPNGTVGIAFREKRLTSTTVSYLKFTERDAGTGVWGTPTTIISSASGQTTYFGLSVRYRTDNKARVVFCNDTAGNSGIAYGALNSGVWTNTNISASTVAFECSLSLQAGDNSPKVSFVNDTNNRIDCYAGSSDGASWASVGTVALTTSPENVWATNLCVQVLNSGAVVTGYWDYGSGYTVRNHTAATTTILSTAGTGKYGMGYCSYYNGTTEQSYAYYASQNGGNSQSSLDNYYYESGSNLSNTTGEVAYNNDASSGTLNAGIVNRGFDNNGPVFASAYYGPSMVGIIIRRVSFRAVWTSAETSDTTLTQWGTYEVGDQVNNSATVTHQVALATASPVSSFNTIVSGQQVNSDATKIFVQTKITCTLGAFAAPVIGSVTLNYTGAGFGAALPTALVFANEYYLSHAYDGGDENTRVAFLDREWAWSFKDLSLSFMTQYKNKLYAGSSTNGYVYILGQNYTNAPAITAVSKEDLLGSLELQKQVYKVYVLHEVKDSGTFTFSYRADNFKYPAGAAWTDTTVDQTDASATPGLKEIPISAGLLSSIQFKINSSSTSVGLGVIGWIIVYSYANIR